MSDPTTSCLAEIQGRAKQYEIRYPWRLLDSAKDFLPRDRKFLLSVIEGQREAIEKAREAIGTENAWDGHARADQLDRTRAALTAPTTEKEN